MQKCEKCYMTFKITPFGKKEKEISVQRKNYIKVNRSQLKIIFLQYNTMSYVGIDSLHIYLLEGMSLSLLLLLLLLMMLKVPLPFSHSQLNVFMLYKMVYLLCKSVHIYRNSNSCFTNVHHVILTNLHWSY